MFTVYLHLYQADCVFQFQEFLTRTASVKDTKILVIACKHPNFNNFVFTVKGKKGIGSKWEVRNSIAARFMCM